MKTTLVKLSLLATVLVLMGCGLSVFGKNVNMITPSDTLVTEQHSLSGFTGLNFSTFGKVTLTQGDSESVTVKGPDNIVPLVKTSVESNILVISMEKQVNITGMSEKNMLTFDITVKDLGSLDISGLGDVSMASLQTQSLDLNMSGAGQVSLDHLAAQSLNLNLSGLGNLQVAGEVDTAKIILSGAGNIQAPDLQIKTANVSISGLGGATLWVTDQLSGDISGAGSVSYYGEPKTSTQKSGLGDFKPLGSK